MIAKIVAALIGIMLICAGLYYLIKEKHDKESQKIYAITLLSGAIIAIGASISIFLIG